MAWSVIVKVIDCESRRPLEDVRINWPDGFNLPTDANGEIQFNVTNPDVDHFWINLRRNGYMYAEFTIHPSADGRREVCMRAAPPGPPPPPQGLHVIDESPGHVTLAWANPRSYERIHVGWSRPGGSHHQLPHLPGTATTTTIRGVFTPGLDYDLGVQGMGSAWASIRWRCPDGRTWFQRNNEPLVDTFLATQTGAAAWSPGRLDVVYGVRGQSRLLGHAWYAGAGFHDEARDVQAPSAIYGFAATSRGPGSLDVFYVSDRQIWHVVHDGAGWHPAYGLGGPPVPAGTGLAAVSWGGERLDVFYKGPDRRLMQRFRWNDASPWSGEVPLPGSVEGRPAAASWGPDRIDIFYRGPDNAIHQTWYDGRAWRSANLGGAIRGDVAVASWSPNRLDVFSQGQHDKRLYHRFHDAGGWSGDIGLGEFPEPGGSGLVGNITGLSAVSWAPNRLDLFYCSVPGTLWHHWHDL